MAFKIKDNLDLYGNQLLNFALQSDSGFPQSPQVGHMFNYTGAGVMANHAVMCVDETTKAFKALAFVDEIATNAEFVKLKEKVDLLIGDDVDTDTIIDSWKEVQAFLAGIEDTKTLQGMLSSYLPLSGGTITSDSYIPLTLNSTNETQCRLAITIKGADKALFGWHNELGTWMYNTPSAAYIGIKNNDGTPFYGNSNYQYTLIHSGNIGDYAIKKNKSIDFQSGLNEAGYGYKAAGWRESGPALMVGASQNYRMALQSTVIDLGGGKYMPELCFNYSNSGEWIGWKYIAFTDSTVAAAQKLVSGTTNTLTASGVALHDANGHQLFSCAATWQAFGNPSSSIDTVLEGGHGIYLKTGSVNRVILNSSGNVTIGDSDLAGTDAKLNVHNILSVSTESATPSAKLNIQQFSSSNAVNGIHLFVGSNNSSYANARPLVLQNSYGNVLIGTTADPGTKLYVSGDTRFDGQTRINGSMRFYGKSGISGDIYLNNQSVGGLLFAYSDKEPLLLVGSNIGIGTDNPQKKLHVVGDLYVEGNIIATKEVSAGGAGQEGESGDGGAEVISQQLASGQSTYTITNTIGRSDIAVSLYEWNANNSSWDMCLADISVKDATITVTFGSATSVNHKLVAVG